MTPTATRGGGRRGGLLLHHRKIAGDENWSWSRSFSGGEWADRHTTEARRGGKREGLRSKDGEWAESGGKEEILLYVQKERRERLVLFAMGWKFQGWKKQNGNIY